MHAVHCAFDEVFDVDASVFALFDVALLSSPLWLSLCGGAEEVVDVVEVDLEEGAADEELDVEGGQSISVRRCDGTCSALIHASPHSLPLPPWCGSSLSPSVHRRRWCHCIRTSPTPRWAEQSH